MRQVKEYIKGKKMIYEVSQGEICGHQGQRRDEVGLCGVNKLEFVPVVPDEPTEPISPEEWIEHNKNEIYNMPFFLNATEEEKDAYRGIIESSFDGMGGLEVAEELVPSLFELINKGVTIDKILENARTLGWSELPGLGEMDFGYLVRGGNYNEVIGEELKYISENDGFTPEYVQAYIIFGKLMPEKYYTYYYIEEDGIRDFIWMGGEDAIGIVLNMLYGYAFGERINTDEGDVILMIEGVEGLRQETHGIVIYGLYIVGPNGLPDGDLHKYIKITSNGREVEYVKRPYGQEEYFVRGPTDISLGINGANAGEKYTVDVLGKKYNVTVK